MAFEMLGIGGVLTFNDTQAARGMTRTKMLLRNVEMRAQRLSMGMRKLGGAVKSLGMISIAAGAGLGFGAKKAMDFEHQMGAVAAVTRSSGVELRRNSDYARKLGIETAFSATQAAGAMEILGKFGLTKEPLRVATKGVTDLAAATGTNMDSAATTMIGTLKSMSLTAKDSTRVANVLALASTKTAANATGLGEAFAYAGSTAQSMGVPLEMTTAIFGTLADKMMIGSRAGTGLMALMRGLQGNTPKVRKLMKKLGIDIEQFGGDMSDMPGIIQHVTDKLNKEFPKATDKIRKARAVTQLFGRFGQVTFNNLAGTGKKKLQELADALKKSGNTAKDKFGNPIGAAAEMAQKRLNTVKGAITLFKSSMESFFISIMSGFLGPMKTRLQNLTTQFNKVLFVLNMFEKNDSAKSQQKAMKKYGKTTTLVALGVRDALKLVNNSWKFVGSQIKRVGAMFGGTVSGSMLRSIVKFGLGITMLLGTLAPLFVGLLAMKFLVTMIAGAVSGLVAVISAVALPAIAVVAAVAGAFLILRKEGESVGETFTRLFMGVLAFGRDIVGSVLMPMFNSINGVIVSFTFGLQQFWESVVASLRTTIYSLIGTFVTVVTTVGELMNTLISFASSVAIKTKPAFTGMIKFGLKVVSVFAGMAKSLAGLFSELSKWVIAAFNPIKPFLLDIVGVVVRAGKNAFAVFSGIFTVLGAIFKGVVRWLTLILSTLRPIFVFLMNWVKVLYTIGKMIFSLLLTPFRMIVGVLKWIWGLTKDYIKPAFASWLSDVKAIYKWFSGLGKVIIDAILWPFRKLSGIMGDIMRKVAKYAKYIPGVSAKAFRGLANTFDSMSGLKKIKISTTENLLTRRGKKSGNVGDENYAQPYASTRDAGGRPVKVRVDNTLNAKITAKTSIDGKCVAAATAGHQVELSERAGFGSSPWQRRAVIARSGLVNPRGRN